MANHLLAVSPLVVVFGLLTVNGCGSPQIPDAKPERETLSYTEALQIYNQELLALDRLQAERAKLQQSLAPDATDLVGGLLEQAGEANAEFEKALDDLSGSGEKSNTEAAESKDDSLEALGQQFRDSQDNRENQRPEIEARIADLDKEIAEQEKRVDRAKIDKDAAELKRH